MVGTRHGSDLGDQRQDILPAFGAYDSCIRALVSGQQSHRREQSELLPEHGRLVVAQADVHTGFAKPRGELFDSRAVTGSRSDLDRSKRAGVPDDSD